MSTSSALSRRPGSLGCHPERKAGVPGQLAGWGGSEESPHLFFARTPHKIVILSEGRIATAVEGPAVVFPSHHRPDHFAHAVTTSAASCASRVLDHACLNSAIVVSTSGTPPALISTRSAIVSPRSSGQMSPSLSSNVQIIP